MELRRRFEISKISDEQRIVYGWAYVSEVGDVGVVDFSGQTADICEIQKAAHGFVRDSRVGGVMHTSLAGEIVESVVFTKELQDALGIDLGRVGWFIGFQVHDEEVWKRVKSGELPAFSIRGTATVEDIAA